MAHSKLSAAHLFSHLPQELTQRLFARSRPVKLAPDQVLFLAGDPGDGCYHVEKGLLKVSVASPAGGERILAILGPGSLIGELAIIDPKSLAESKKALKMPWCDAAPGGGKAAPAPEKPERSEKSDKKSKSSPKKADSDEEKENTSRGAKPKKGGDPEEGGE